MSNMNHEHQIEESTLLDADFTPETSLDATLTRKRFSLRRALTSGAVFIALLVTIAALIFHVITPVPPTHIIAGTVAIYSTVNFGTITVNEKKSTYRASLTVPIERGKNTITLSVPHFTPKTCILNVPASANDTCGFTKGELGGSWGTTVMGAIYLPLLVGDVNDATRSDAVDLLSQLGSGSAITSGSAGEYYTVGTSLKNVISIQKATTPFSAYLETRTYQTLSCNANQPCYEEPSANIVHIWRVAQDYQVFWHFNSASGAFSSTTPANIYLSIVHYLSIDDAGHWYSLISTQHGIPFKSLSDQALIDLSLVMSNLVIVANIAKPSLTFESRGVLSLEGVLQDAFSTDGGSKTPAGRYLFRFGVLYAADDLAHHAAPSLLVATPTMIADAMLGHPQP